jgi:DNA-binding SARP family transcriptional activator
MSRLALSVLGAFQAVLNQQSLTAFRSDKARALLVFLAIEAGRPHAREALASLLWPECSDSVALTYLRSALTNLRHLFGDQTNLPPGEAPPFLLITRKTVQLNAEADVWLDTVALAELLAGNPSLQALEQAAALCHGPFLEGFSIGDSEPFDEWLLFQREHANRQTLSALRRLAAAYIDSGRYAEAGGHIRRQLALDPWDEGAHRQRMLALALDGQRSAALAHYEACRRLLADELGIAPARETTELCERIRSGALPVVTARQPGPAPLITPFVARERELARLDAHLALTLQGHGRVVFVTGDAGSGKSTLLNEFARRAMAVERDAIVASGKCNATSGLGDPHLPFREVVQMLAGDIEVRRAGGVITPEHAQRLWAIVPLAARAMAETSPDLINRFVPGEALLLRLDALMSGPGRAVAPIWRARLAGLVKRRSSAGPASTTLNQTELFEQITAFLCTLARSQPLIILLDDLHWADSGSIRLLFHLGRRLDGNRLLIVGAFRAESLALGRDGGRHPLPPVVNELQRDFGDILIDLNQDSGHSFIASLLDATPNRLGSAFRETLYRHTGGNPLFTVELLRGLSERRHLVLDAAGCWVERGTLDWQTLPARVEAVIAERIAQLPAAWQALLRAASVEGEEFTAEVLARVQHMEQPEVIRYLSGPLSHDYHIVRAHSLQRTGNRSLSRYRFRHGLFRQYLYGQLDELERAHLHEATGAVLEAMFAAGDVSDTRLASQLAWQFEQAGSVAKAVHYRRQAGDEAMHLSACEEAIANYMRGLALLAALPESRERTKQELALQRAVSIPLFMTRGWGGSETAAALTRADALARTLGTRGYLASALSELSLIYLGQGDFARSLELGEELLRLAQQDQDSANLATAHEVLGVTQLFQGKLQQAREHLEQSLAESGAQQPATCQRRVGVELTVDCMSFLALLLLVQGYAEQAARWSKAALDRAQMLDQQPTLAFAQLVAGVLFHSIRGDPDMVQLYAQELVPLATEKGWELYRVWGMMGQGLGHAQQQPAATALAQLQQSMAGWQSMGTNLGRVGHLIVLADAYLRAGRIEEAVAAVDDALSVAERTGLRFFEAEAWRLKGEILARHNPAGQADVEACLQRAIDTARRQTARLLELRATVSLARLWQGQGRAAEARALLMPIYNWFSEGFEIHDLAEAHTLLQDLGSDPRTAGKDNA